MTVETLALTRANLPPAPGATLVEQLANAHRMASEALLKHVPTMQHDRAAADAVLDRVNAWVERNREELETALQDPSREQLGEALCLAFDASMAQQYVLACFTTAAGGIEPWLSGWVAREVDAGRLPQSWATADADNRLRVFQSILRMQESGFLQHLFHPGPGDAPCPHAMGAFGIGPLMAIILAAGAVAAVAICTWIVVAKSTPANQAANQYFLERCRDAAARGDRSMERECLQMARDMMIDTPARKIGVTAVYVLGGLGLAYMLLRLGEREGWTKAPEGGAYGVAARGFSRVEEAFGAFARRRGGSGDAA